MLVPIIEAMITLSSVMTKRDLQTNAFTLKDLGIDQLDKEQLLAYLYKGEYPQQN